MSDQKREAIRLKLTRTPDDRVTITDQDGTPVVGVSAANVIVLPSQTPVMVVQLLDFEVDLPSLH